MSAPPALRRRAAAAAARAVLHRRDRRERAPGPARACRAGGPAALGFTGPVYPVTPTYARSRAGLVSPRCRLCPQKSTSRSTGAAVRVPDQLEAAIAAGVGRPSCSPTPLAAHRTRCSCACWSGDRRHPAARANSLGFVNFAAARRSRGRRPWSPVRARWRSSPSRAPHTPTRTTSTPGPVQLHGARGTGGLGWRRRPVRYALSRSETRSSGSTSRPPRPRGGLGRARRRRGARRPGRGDPAGPQRALAPPDRDARRPHRGQRCGVRGAFRAHDVARAATVDEWWATIALLAAPRRPRPAAAWRR